MSVLRYQRVFLVTFQMIPPRPNPELVGVMQSFEDWWHFLDLTWLIVTSETAEGVYSRMAPTLQQSDRELIIQIKPGSAFAGWLPQQAWAWIEARVGPSVGR